MALSPVIVRRDPVVLPTYEPLPPDKNPMFLERRVYQGSSGKVYPLPCYNRISETKRDRRWDAVHIENEFIRVMVLPEIGGRIHVGEDKTNGYDFFYRQNVIKPALVGLAGPWASGGVEFNWPQHHRPGTFMPVDVEVEEHSDGSKTIWLSSHDPMERMKGMHGVCLHPDRAVIEVKARAYNRTSLVQTFLWWANVATHAHEGYQSFFPPDVTAVADHAKRATSRFPLCTGRYYGINYGERARRGIAPDEVPRHFKPPSVQPGKMALGIPNYPPNDLSWYANIPVPTSYMCLGSTQDFSGGYDFKKRAGLVQVANHHIAPGKKQWTWGNHEFGYAWDRNLTDWDGPYIELMLGVYTDNQPDFSFLQPGETKAWSVFWYPIQSIGPAQSANVDAAISFAVEGRRTSLGVAVTRRVPNARIELRRGGRLIQQWRRDLAPDQPFLTSFLSSRKVKKSEMLVRVATDDDRELLSYAPQETIREHLPTPAEEPKSPGELVSVDELFLTGQHLAQYRHATRSPVIYWEEALRRDPGDARCNHSLGQWYLRRGEFQKAEALFKTAIARLTLRNPNPADGEPFYSLGLALGFQSRFEEAYAAFYKATWNYAWQSASFHALAEIDCRRGHWAQALEHLDRSLRVNQENLRARDLRVIVLRHLQRDAEAEALLAATLQIDPLDWWARSLKGDTLRCDTQTRIDVALDYARAGLLSEAIAVLDEATPEPFSGTQPLIDYHLAYFHCELGNSRRQQAALRRAMRADPDYCFPSRLEEISILESAMEANPKDARAAYYLGNLFYDRRRYDEAIACWERSVAQDPNLPVVWRNLGIAYFNVRHSAKEAERAYERAFAANPRDARVFYERDQLWKRSRRSIKERLEQFEKHPDLVAQRDDAAIEFCALLNQANRPADALTVLENRNFQPWEGGEGMALGQYVRTHLGLGRAALRSGDFEKAIREFSAALEPTPNLGEARHLLTNQSEISYWLGEAHASAGQPRIAAMWWRRAASTRGDFQEMSVRAYSEITYFTGRALARLGRSKAARKLFSELLAYAEKLGRTPASIDYFATSLPTMLLFDDDIQARQKTTALFLRAQANLGLGRSVGARKDLRKVLRRDPSHAAAADLLSEIGVRPKD